MWLCLKLAPSLLWPKALLGPWQNLHMEWNLCMQLVVSCQAGVLPACLPRESVCVGAWSLPLWRLGELAGHKTFQESLVHSSGISWAEESYFLWHFFLCLYPKNQPLSHLSLCVFSFLCIFIYMCLDAQLCLILFNPIDYSPPGSPVHGILQVRILEWVVISYSRGSCWPRDWTHISCVSCIGRWGVFIRWAIREIHIYLLI